MWAVTDHKTPSSVRLLPLPLLRHPLPRHRGPLHLTVHQPTSPRDNTNMKLLLLLGGLAAQAAADMITVTTTFTGLAPIDIPSPTTNNFAALETPPGLKCFDDRKPWPCFGVSHANLNAAIDWFCSNFSAITYHHVPDEAKGTWQYEPDLAFLPFQANGDSPPIGEQGSITVSISVIGDGCDPGIVVPADSCSGWLHYPVNSCDTEGYDRKHGGYIDAGCLRYSIQPNPKFWPECGYFHCSEADHHCWLDGNPTPPIQTPAV
ncbi:hypothetical protein CB0940_11004 [Cercospora beticola]|uniref:Uncharacterized protein n=2 Tax=Cercospora beticola TaxID=122368 RepID=A0A2G5HDV7_CERBT|nr:hypothetical protein CB0940_11004 [Cercospora beticola]PIA90746.1 hypothetical protein CB0940_11004 [Cercospora beticola]